MAPDWFRSPDWTATDREDFETRLKRARATSRPQYLRIKALAIRDEFPLEAEELLRRVVVEYVEHWPDVAFAHELLGDLRSAAGDIGDAETHYRSALETSPTLSGTTGEVHLKLGELLLDRDGPTDDVYAMLEISQRHLTLNHSVFRWHVLRARASDAIGDRVNAATSAQIALDLLDAPPQFVRHPTVGLARAEPELTETLRRLANGSRPLQEERRRSRWRRK
jgi:predicted Zn-dependent protease